MLSTPSLRHLFSSTLQDCILDSNERHETNDQDGSTPWSSSRLQLDSDHIVTQMIRPLDEETQATPDDRPNCSTADNPSTTTSSGVPVRYHLPLRPSNPPCTTPPPTPCTHAGPSLQHLSFRRRNTAPSTDSARRHGIVLSSPRPSSDTPCTSDPLPPYTPPPLRRATTSSPDPTTTYSSRLARQLELRELQHQWTLRRRSHPSSPPSTERTHFRPEISQLHDLPPPYAPRDPYPLFKNERRPRVWSRAVLCPFVPEGEMRDRAALRTERWAGRVVRGVKGVGRGRRRKGREDRGSAGGGGGERDGGGDGSNEERDAEECVSSEVEQVA